MTTTDADSAPHRLDNTPSPPPLGRNELGTISIDDSVVSKIASRAALEVPDAGAAAPRVFGKSMAAARAIGIRPTSLTDLPKTSAHVDGSIVLIDLSISVRWPCPVPEVTQAVRKRVRDRVGELTGLDVAEITIEVTDLVTNLAPPPRVH